MTGIAYAQAGDISQAVQSPIIGLLPIIMIFGIFYFLVLRPQKKQQDMHAAMIKSLNKNDEIIFSGAPLTISW